MRWRISAVKGPIVKVIRNLSEIFPVCASLDIGARGLGVRCVKGYDLIKFFMKGSNGVSQPI